MKSTNDDGIDAVFVAHRGMHKLPPGQAPLKICKTTTADRRVHGVFRCRLVVDAHAALRCICLKYVGQIVFNACTG